MSCLRMRTSETRTPRPWLVLSQRGTELCRCPSFAAAEKAARNITGDGRAGAFTIERANA